MSIVLCTADKRRLYEILDIKGKIAFTETGLGRLEALEEMVLAANEEAFAVIRAAIKASAE